MYPSKCVCIHASVPQWLQRWNQTVFSIWSHHKHDKCPSYLIPPLHLNTYVKGLRSLYWFNSFSAGTVFRRQILTSKDCPRAERVRWVGSHVNNRRPKYTRRPTVMYMSTTSTIYYITIRDTSRQDWIDPNYGKMENHPVAKLIFVKCSTPAYNAIQSQNAVTAYFKSNQLLPFVFVQ